MNMRALGTCPVCDGTGRMAAGNRQYKMVIYGYDAKTDTLGCNNCGGQYMDARPTGQVPLNHEGQPCRHVYKGVPGRWRCTTDYVCQHCHDTYMIDSGD